MFVHLEHDVDHDDKEGMGKVEEQPDLDGLDGSSGRTALNDKIFYEINSGKDREQRTYMRKWFTLQRWRGRWR